ncbi:hypothetical protein [Aeropyrum camini]|uniref:hypothetical protein n=1 Tax=Aeropyrum camini TaxID=229980 RepID=UPI0012E23A27|nr:hypothetical protein [Aeropyrum camini]
MTLSAAYALTSKDLGNNISVTVAGSSQVPVFPADNSGNPLAYAQGSLNLSSNTNILLPDSATVDLNTTRGGLVLSLDVDLTFPQATSSSDSWQVVVLLRDSSGSVIANTGDEVTATGNGTTTITISNIDIIPKVHISKVKSVEIIVVPLLP